MRLLVVDDDEVTLGILGETLQFLGYRDLVFALSGAAALAVVDGTPRPFDCFLFDIRMPGMDGVDLCKAIRARPEYGNSPIIMVTALTGKDTVDRAFAAGATDYVTKPIDVLELGTRMGLAGMLVSERRAITESAVIIKALKFELDSHAAYALGEAMDLRDVERVIGYTSFENYLLQLTRGVLFLSSVFAVKIKDIDGIHAITSARAFKRVLVSTARFITSNLEPPDSFLSYRGNGLFVGVIPRQYLPAYKAIKNDPTRAQGVVKYTRKTDGGVGKVDLIFGDPISPGLFSRPGSLSFLCRAIDSVDSRHGETNLSSTVSPAIRRHRSWHDQEAYLDGQLREEYEQLLRESLNEDMPPIRSDRNRPSRSEG